MTTRPTGCARTRARASTPVAAALVPALLACLGACRRSAPDVAVGLPPPLQARALGGALYLLRGTDGTTGQARVWSDGLRTDTTPPVLEVSLAVSSGGPLAIGVSVDRALLGPSSGTLAGPLAPVVARSHASVAAGTMALLAGAFELPRDVDPASVDCFRLDWHAVIGLDTLPHTTVFVRPGTATGSRPRIPFSPSEQPEGAPGASGDCPTGPAPYEPPGGPPGPL